MIIATHGILANSGGIIYTGLLDTYSGAVGAYSLRRLTGSYTGYAIRVRRSNDNATQDIGFNIDGTLDTTSLLSFCNIHSGYVSIWYDQSGNVRNLTQTSSSNQFRIVNAGSLQSLNGKVACYAPPEYTAYMDCNFGSLISQPITLFHIGSHPIGEYLIYDGYNSTNRVALITGLSSELYLYAGSQIRTDGLVTSVSTQRLIYAMANSTSSTLGFNTTTGTIGNVGTQGLDGIKFGAAFNNTYYMKGYHQEFIIWGSNQNTNRTGISNNMNTYYSIY